MPTLRWKLRHGDHGVVADAAVGAAGIEAERGQALLDFLHFGERRRALAAGEWLHERSAAHDAVAEMHDRQRVVHRRIVGAHGIEVRPEQESRAARHRHPQLARSLGLRERLAVGAR